MSSLVESGSTASCGVRRLNAVRAGRYTASMTPLTPGLVLIATAISVGRARRQLGRTRILATPLAARRRAFLEERLFDALASGDRERVWHYRRALGR
jgi:hypothetical protein